MCSNCTQTHTYLSDKKFFSGFRQPLLDVQVRLRVVENVSGEIDIERDCPTLSPRKDI